MSNIKTNTRRGAASFYVVIFAALVFTVIVLSFIRLMTSESSQNTADDLSKSAYDSALAGVEDAKTAIAICQQNPTAPGCANLFKDDCEGNHMTNVLKGNNSNSITNTVSDSADQSYTCVVLKKDLEDYRVAISPAEPTKVIHLPGTDGNGAGVKTVHVSWFTIQEFNDTAGNKTRSFSNTNFPQKSSAPVPPVASIGVIENGQSHVNTVVFRPSDKNEGPTVQAAYANAYNQSGDNTPVSSAKTGNNNKNYFTCSTGGVGGTDFICQASIEVKGSNAEYVVLYLPYDNNSVSFKVEQLDASGNIIRFGDSQIAVDSTGRAADRYRRVESRLVLEDTHFPYPDFALRASDGSGNGNITKNFYVTNNCWYATNGAKTTCDNSHAL